MQKTKLQFCNNCIEVGWHEFIPGAEKWENMKCQKCGTITHDGAIMDTDACTKWCRKLEQCNYAGSDEIDMSRVRQMIVEFSHLTLYDQNCVMAYVCGQLTGWRHSLGIKKYEKHDYQWRYPK